MVDKQKDLYNRHTESRRGRRSTQCYGGADGTKSDGGIAYRFLITFGINALGIKLLKMCASKLRRSMAPTVPL